MFKVKSLTTKISDNFYGVFIESGDEPIYYQIHNADDAEEALRVVLEYEYGDCDWVYECSFKGSACCVYDVTVVDDVE